MKTAEQWLNDYSLTHRHPTNKIIHYICVPLILWSVLALLWVAPKPHFADSHPILNWAILLVVGALAFYLRLGFSYFLGMLMVAVFALSTIVSLQSNGYPLAWIAVFVFVGAWIGQFYGHKIEGKKPSFFDDLLFLLIGPLWIQNRIFGKREQPNL
jgi:uncharacterized membrane protein YGL010W